MDWKQIIPGVVIGIIIGVGSTFFLFQGRISKLEAHIESSTNTIADNGEEQHTDKSEIDRLFKQTKYIVKINQPNNGDNVKRNITVDGSFSGNLFDFHLWVVVHPVDSMGWWPQQDEIIPNPTDGRWEIPVTLGEKAGPFANYEILMLLAKKEAHESFINYIKEGLTTSVFPGKPLPRGTRVLAKTNVTRN